MSTRAKDKRFVAVHIMTVTKMQTNCKSVLKTKDISPPWLLTADMAHILPVKEHLILACGQGMVAQDYIAHDNI